MYTIYHTKYHNTKTTIFKFSTLWHFSIYHTKYHNTRTTIFNFSVQYDISVYTTIPYHVHPLFVNLPLNMECNTLHTQYDWSLVWKYDSQWRFLWLFYGLCFITEFYLHVTNLGKSTTLDVHIQTIQGLLNSKFKSMKENIYRPTRVVMKVSTHSSLTKRPRIQSP